MTCDICGKEKNVWGYCVCVDCYMIKKQDQIAKLKQQLAEKDEEIKQLNMHDKNLRHEICEEIRNAGYPYEKETEWGTEISGYYLPLDYLDEIEQGENNGNNKEETNS